MSVLSFLGLKKSDEEKASEAAASNKVASDKQNAITIANYRQNSRDQYHNLLTSETSPYQAYSDRLAAMYGQGMSTAGLSADENPVTLRDTGSGAPVGSNYVGWDSPGADPTSINAPGSLSNGQGVVHHVGIQDYLNGTAPKNTTTLNANGMPAPLQNADGSLNWSPDRSADTVTGRNADGSVKSDYWSVGPSADALSAAGLAPGGQTVGGQAPVSSAPRLTSPGPQGPAAGLTFMPRKQ